MKLDEKIKNGRQYRNLTLAPDEESDEKVVRGYASTFDEEYLLYKTDEYEVWEKVDRHAFDKADMEDVIFQYDHEGRVFARISNNTLDIKTDDHGLFILANLGGTEEGRKLFEEIKGGYTTKMSFGFMVSGDTVEEARLEGKRTKYTRTITEVSKVFDVSAVSLPANDGTTISARAFCDGVIAKAEAERLLKAETERKRKALELRIKLMEV